MTTQMAKSGLVNSADQGWYRFLSGHMSGSGQGVEGYEDGHWEAGQPNLARGQANNHNEYIGFQKKTAAMVLLLAIPPPPFAPAAMVYFISSNIVVVPGSVIPLMPLFRIQRVRNMRIQEAQATNMTRFLR